jgi:FkbM family methyltransferase
MRVFLDVGAHEGQTLREVLAPEWAFDRIYAFEPASTEYDYLVASFVDPRLTIKAYGLWDRTATLPLFGSNDDMEASMFDAKTDVDGSIAMPCWFVEASEFFRKHIADTDTVIVKLNCEGAETAIMHNLIDSGEVWKIDHVMIDFDVRKIPGMESAETDLCERLEAIGFTNYAPSEQVMLGETHQDRIASWLGVCP